LPWWCSSCALTTLLLLASMSSCALTTLLLLASSSMSSCALTTLLFFYHSAFMINLASYTIVYSYRTSHGSLPWKSYQAFKIISSFHTNWKNLTNKIIFNKTQGNGEKIFTNSTIIFTLKIKIYCTVGVTTTWIRFVAKVIPHQEVNPRENKKRIEYTHGNKT